MPCNRAYSDSGLNINHLRGHKTYLDSGRRIEEGSVKLKPVSNNVLRQLAP